MTTTSKEDLQDGLDLLREGPHVREALFNLMDGYIQKQGYAILNSLIKYEKQGDLLISHAEFSGMQKLATYLKNKLEEKQ